MEKNYFYARFFRGIQIRVIKMVTVRLIIVAMRLKW